LLTLLVRLWKTCARLCQSKDDYILVDEELGERIGNTLCQLF
jgi:hypothetical protein